MNWLGEVQFVGQELPGLLFQILPNLFFRNDKKVMIVIALTFAFREDSGHDRRRVASRKSFNESVSNHHLNQE